MTKEEKINWLAMNLVGDLQLIPSDKAYDLTITALKEAFAINCEEHDELLTQARQLIGHIGWTSVERTDVLSQAELWIEKVDKLKTKSHE